MKQSLFFTILITAFILSACKKYKNCSIILGEAFTVSNNSSACSEKENITVTFTKVENDSRCPIGSACFWEGLATIKLTLKKENTEHPFTLHTLLPQVYGYNNDTVVAGYKIKLILLDPYPDGQPPNAKEYKAKLVVTQ